MAKSATKSKTSGKASAARKRSAKVSPAEKAAREAERHAPVGLGSGASYDREVLQKGLEKVVDRDPDNRDAEVQSALEAADAGDNTSRAAPGAIPNHDVMRTETVLSPGVEVGEGKAKQVLGRETVTEYRQVFTGDASDVTAADVKGSAVGTGGKSEVVAMEKVADAPKPKAPDKLPDTGTSVPAQDGETGETGSTSNPDAVQDEIEGAAAGLETPAPAE
jgi:hypothetical protein